MQPSSHLTERELTRFAVAKRPIRSDPKTMRWAGEVFRHGLPKFPGGAGGGQEPQGATEAEHCAKTLSELSSGAFQYLNL